MGIRISNHTLERGKVKFKNGESLTIPTRVTLELESKNLSDISSLTDNIRAFEIKEETQEVVKEKGKRRKSEGGDK